MRGYVMRGWSDREDQELVNMVLTYGTDNWRQVSRRMPGRSPRQCKERWVSYLSKKLGEGWTAAEERILIAKHNELGDRWTCISLYLEGKSPAKIKYHWYNAIMPNKRNYPLLSNNLLFDFSIQSLLNKDGRSASPSAKAAIHNSKNI